MKHRKVTNQIFGVVEAVGCSIEDSTHSHPILKIKAFDSSFYSVFLRKKEFTAWKNPQTVIKRLVFAAANNL